MSSWNDFVFPEAQLNSPGLAGRLGPAHTGSVRFRVPLCVFPAFHLLSFFFFSWNETLSHLWGSFRPATGHIRQNAEPTLFTNKGGLSNWAGAARGTGVQEAPARTQSSGSLQKRTQAGPWA